MKWKGTREAPPRRCRQCGCTDDRACPGGCWWVEWDLCSACADLTDRQLAESLAQALESLDGIECEVYPKKGGGK